MRHRGSAVLAAAACGLIALSSCSLQTLGSGLANGGAEQTPAALHAVEHRYSSGGVTFIVKASSTTINTAQTLTLTLISESASGWMAHLPAVGDKLGRFSVAARVTHQPTLSGGTTTDREASFELEPFLPGSYVIPPFSVSATNGTTTKVISSDPIRVTVTSLVPNGAKEPLKLKALAGPVPEPSVWPEVIAGGAVLIAVIAATVIMLIGRIMRRRRERITAVPPWVRATKDLDRLVRLDLTMNGRHKEFYNRISLLVRRYIEELFEIKAPEQTTEEFLYSVRYSSVLGRHRRFLGEFLAHCDLVKFSAYLPAQDEVHRAIRSCREFISSTSRDYSGSTGEGPKDR